MTHHRARNVLSTSDTAAPRSAGLRSARPRAQGFSLLELMIVVVIVGILAAIAIPSYRGYIYRSKTAEAITFLGEIRQRQESYRAEFGQFCAGAAGGAVGFGAWNPSTLPAGGTREPWNATAAPWDQLGATPDGLNAFQYRMSAGPPGTAAGVPGMPTSDFWFVAQGQGDLDGDGEVVIFEIYSPSNHIFVGDGSMTFLASGWE